MRCLVLGGDGMLGHQLLKLLAGHQVRVTLRRPLGEYSSTLFTSHNAYAGVDVRDTPRLIEVLGHFRPEAIINAVGVIKQRREAHDPTACIEINALFPHRLLALCRAIGARLIHVSTDCVFSGERGHYSEQDIPDAADLYGRSKHMGEVTAPPALTLRTSIIGLELKHFASLVEWYLRQHGSIRGFRRAIYSGFTTAELARIIRLVLEDHAELSGLWHVSANAISKYELLSKLSDQLARHDLTLVPDDQLTCDRSLDGSAFRQQTGYCAPDWDTMLAELAAEIRQRMQGIPCYDAA